MHYPQLDAEVSRYQRLTGQTQRQVATQLGMTEQTFSAKRRGRDAEFTLGEFVALCDLLGVESYDSMLR